MGLKGNYGFGGPESPLDLIPLGHLIEVFQTPSYEEGEGLAIALAGDYLKVNVRLEGTEATAWCSLERLFEALEEQTRAMGS